MWNSGQTLRPQSTECPDGCGEMAVFFFVAPDGLHMHNKVEPAAAEIRAFRLWSFECGILRSCSPTMRVSSTGSASGLIGVLTKQRTVAGHSS